MENLSKVNRNPKKPKDKVDGVDRDGAQVSTIIMLRSVYVADKSICRSGIVS